MFSLLVYEIANYNLKLHRRREDMGKRNLRTFTLAQRFFRMAKHEVEVHNVPRFSLDDVLELAKVLEEQFEFFRGDVSVLKKELIIAKQKVKDAEYSMQVQKLEQNRYFENEKNILEEIAASVSETWEWNTKYR